MSSLSPVVEWLDHHKVPRGVAIILVFILIFLILAGLITLVVIPLVNQLPALISQITMLPETVTQLDFINQDLIQEEVTSYFSNAINVLLDLFNNIILLFTVIIVSIYLLFEHEDMYKLLPVLFKQRGKLATHVLSQIENKLGAWLRGQILVAGIIGTLYYIVLQLFGVGFALPLAVLGALLEFVPIIGPWLAGIPAVAISLTISPITALQIGISYFLIQEVESHLLVPLLMNKVIGLNPLLIIFAVLVGGTLLGLIGILLAVPIAAVIQILYEEVVTHKKT